uniref:hypothetical protein n=1 Tax=Klebsiella pneumoniae TaxID=573 RepID=UPI001E40CDE3|nr:hypothetical protein [Klebsiella pneumoniae]
MMYLGTAVERNWTPERFIERIFWWLRESAEQRLHREDQPLEQLFYMSPYQLFYQRIILIIIMPPQS